MWIILRTGRYIRSNYFIIAHHISFLKVGKGGIILVPLIKYNNGLTINCPTGIH